MNCYLRKYHFSDRIKLYLYKKGDSVTVSKKQQASVNRYIAKSYDRINLTVPKGKKEIIQNFAQSVGESVNGFINRAIDDAMKEDEK